MSTKKSAEYIAGMNAALREVRSVCDAAGKAAEAAKNDGDRDTFGERARGAAECEQYIMTAIELAGGEPDPE
jgi:hypothetical protein